MYPNDGAAMVFPIRVSTVTMDLEPRKIRLLRRARDRPDTFLRRPTFLSPPASVLRVDLDLYLLLQLHLLESLRDLGQRATGNGRLGSEPVGCKAWLTFMG